MAVNIKVTGIKPMQRRLTEVAVSIEARALRALTSAAGHVLKRATVVTPKEDGHLRASGVVDPAERQGNDLVAVVAFGRSGPSQAYAQAMHEHPNGPSPRSWRAHVGALNFTLSHTGHKFLERPLRDEVPTVQSIIARTVKL